MRGFIHRSAITGLAAAVFSSIAIPATAGEALRVRCEQRADRSVVSVDAKNLPDGGCSGGFGSDRGAACFGTRYGDRNRSPFGRCRRNSSSFLNGLSRSRGDDNPR